MNIALVDLPNQRSNLFPFTMTRPIGDLRIGILTIQEKWEKYLGQKPDLLSTALINAKFQKGPAPYDLVINAAICPDIGLVNAIKALTPGQELLSDGAFIAAYGNFEFVEDLEDLNAFETKTYTKPYCLIERTWTMFLENTAQIKADYALLVQNRTSQKIEDPHTIVYGVDNIFIEEGVKIRAAVLNAENGPIYLSKGSEIQEGATIRGPFFLGENSRINMGTKVREGTSIGPYCKVGGEISNSILFGNSNKAHDGFLGNSVIGEFCNLGAGTNSSNLKNNYDNVKVWDYTQDTFIDSGLQFCGTMMGDHSKSAIGTMFNTGTVVGVCCNVYGSGFPRTIIPAFSWGGASKLVLHTFDKAIKTAQVAMARREVEMTSQDVAILKSIFEVSSKEII